MSTIPNFKQIFDSPRAKLIAIGGGVCLLVVCVLVWLIVSASTAAPLPANEQIPDAAQIGIFALIGAFLSAVTAFAVGLRAPSTGLTRPPGYPMDPTAEQARFINAYNVLKEKAANPGEAEPTAQSFALDLYLRAVNRKSIDAPSSPLPSRGNKDK